MLAPVVTGRETKTAILETMRLAKHTLEVTTHRIDDPHYIKAIKKAADRGVRVHILVSDPSYAGYSKKKAREARRSFVSLGLYKNITVLDYPNSRLQYGTAAWMPEHHRKVVSSDGKRAYTGDSNLRHHENNLGAGVYIEGETARALERVFLNAWVNARGSVTKSAPIKPNPRITVLDTRSSDRDIKPRLIADLHKAKRSIFVMQYLLSDPDIISTLIQIKKKKPQMQINVLLGQRNDTISVMNREVNVPFNLPAYRDLTKAGIDARFVASKNFVHGKLAVIDGRTTHLGSADLAARSLEGNMETNLRIESKELGKHYLDNLLPHFQLGTTTRVSRRDTAAIALTQTAEALAFSAYRAGDRVMQTKRNIRLKKEFVVKGARIAGQLIERIGSSGRFAPVDLHTLRNPKKIAGQIDARYHIVAQEKLATPSNGVYLVAGHSSMRADAIKNLGSQMAYHGDFGPGLYLADDVTVAHEYSALFGKKGTGELVVYEAKIKRPFRIPAQKAEYQAWLSKHPGKTKQPFWQRLSEFAKNKGYDSAIIEHFEGKDRSYFLVFDRNKVRPLHTYSVKPRKTAGLKRVLKNVLRGRTKRPQKAAKDTTALSGCLASGWCFKSGTTSASQYKKRVLSIMKRDRGLESEKQLNGEIADFHKHIVFDIQSATGRSEALFRMIPNYDLTKYASLYKTEYAKLGDLDIAGIALYPKSPEKEFNGVLYKTALAAAAAHAKSNGGPTTLYVEVRPERLKFFKGLGFRVAGLPFRARAWSGEWVPLLLDLGTYKTQ